MTEQEAKELINKVLNAAMLFNKRLLDSESWDILDAQTIMEGAWRPDR